MEMGCELVALRIILWVMSWKCTEAWLSRLGVEREALRWLPYHLHNNYRKLSKCFGGIVFSIYCVGADKEECSFFGCESIAGGENYTKDSRNNDAQIKLIYEGQRRQWFRKAFKVLTHWTSPHSSQPLLAPLLHRHRLSPTLLTAPFQGKSLPAIARAPFEDFNYQILSRD